MRLRVSIAGHDLAAEVANGTADGPRLAGVPGEQDVQRIAPGLYSVIVDGRSFEVVLEPVPEAAGEALVSVDGLATALQIEDERTRALPTGVRTRAAGQGGAGYTVVAPMPGRVVAVPCSLGDAVERGQTVVVLEAMKMESALTTPHAGRIAEILVSPGETVRQRQALIRLDG
jgi:biotin carboxyl carrier protein